MEFPAATQPRSSVTSPPPTRPGCAARFRPSPPLVPPAGAAHRPPPAHHAVIYRCPAALICRDAAGAWPTLPHVCISCIQPPPVHQPPPLGARSSAAPLPAPAAPAAPTPPPALPSPHPTPQVLCPVAVTLLNRLRGLASARLAPPPHNRPLHTIVGRRRRRQGRMASEDLMSPKSPLARHAEGVMASGAISGGGGARAEGPGRRRRHPCIDLL